jgi:5'-deoxynucleotidase YfbR-like HD superfamily hydrolase
MSGLNDVRLITNEMYVPFANIERQITWPQGEERMENDAEHSFSLALVGMALGEQIGLDPQKIAYYATIHDLPELYAGDTSVWDEEGLTTKEA